MTPTVSGPWNGHYEWNCAYEGIHMGNGEKMNVRDPDIEVRPESTFNRIRTRICQLTFVGLIIALVISSFEFRIEWWDHSLYYSDRDWSQNEMSLLRNKYRTHILQILLLTAILVVFNRYLEGLNTSLEKFFGKRRNLLTMTSFVLFFLQFGVLWPFVFVWTEEGIIWMLAFPSFVVCTEFIILLHHLEDNQILVPWMETQVYDSAVDAIHYPPPSRYSPTPPVNMRARRLWQFLIFIFVLYILLMPKYHHWTYDLNTTGFFQVPFLLLYGELLMSELIFVCCLSLIPLFFINVALYFKYRNLVSTYLPLNHRFKVTTTILKLMVIFQPIFAGIYWFISWLAYIGGN